MSNPNKALTLAHHKREGRKHLHTLYHPYFLAVDVLALWEKTLGLPPCEIVKAVFPCDKYQRVVADAVSNAFCKYLEKVFDTDLPKANWLPSLKAFAKLYSKNNQ